jgi:hypothetical protein
MPESTAPTRGVRWDALAAIIASLVGLLALLIAGYTAVLQRQQVRAQVWPYLLSASSDVSTQYLWMNKGVGPAMVQSTQVFVDGKPQQNWKAVMSALRLGSLNYGQSTLSGNVLSAGETLEWLKFENSEDFRHFREAAKSAKLDFRVCYCSTLGECWVVGKTEWSMDSRVPIEMCPAVPESEQFKD